MKGLIRIFPNADEWYWTTPQGCALIRRFVASACDVLGDSQVRVHATDNRIVEALRSDAREFELSASSDPLAGLDADTDACLMDFRAFHAPDFLPDVMARLEETAGDVVATIAPLEHHPCQSFALASPGQIGHVFPLVQTDGFLKLRGCAPSLDAPDTPGFYAETETGWTLTDESAAVSGAILRVADDGTKEVLYAESVLPTSHGRLPIGLSWPAGAVVWSDGDTAVLRIEPAETTRLFINAHDHEAVLDVRNGRAELPSGIAGEPFFYSILEPEYSEEHKAIMPMLSTEGLWWVDDSQHIIDGRNGRHITGRQHHLPLYDMDQACIAGRVSLLRNLHSAVAEGKVRGLPVTEQEVMRVDSSLSFLEMCKDDIDDILRQRVRQSLKKNRAGLDVTVPDTGKRPSECLKNRDLGKVMANLHRQAHGSSRKTRSISELLQRVMERSCASDSFKETPRYAMTARTRLWEKGYLGPGAMLGGYYACLENHAGRIGLLDSTLKLVRQIELPFETICDFDVDADSKLALAVWPFTVVRGPSFDTVLFDEQRVESMGIDSSVNHAARIAARGDRIALILRGSRRIVVYSLNAGRDWKILETATLGHSVDLAWNKDRLFLALENPSMVCRFDVEGDELSLKAFNALANAPGQVEASDDGVYVHSSSTTGLFDFDLKRIGTLSISSLGVSQGALASSWVTAFHDETGRGVYVNSNIENSVTRLEC